MTSARVPDPLGGVAARLALRQQNLSVLFPVLLHDVNGSLNGLALATELLSRLQQREVGDPVATASLMQRSRNELGRLKQSVRALEARVAPGLVGQAPALVAPPVATLRDVHAVLLPAARRGQHEWRFDAGNDDPEVRMRPEDLFDLLAGLAIVLIEGAPASAGLEFSVEADPVTVSVRAGHAGPARASMALEVHRELLRAAVVHAGGALDWQQGGDGTTARLRLPRAGAAA